jgi:serine/threonine protein kinase
MSEEAGGKPADAGNAMDALTPPTMKYANQPEGEMTQIGPAPSQPPGKNTTVSRNNSSPTIGGGAGGRGGDSMMSDMQMQDLSNERLLKDAPRVESNGKMVPALNRIPLLTKIGQGGMGAVYYGIHPRLNSEVAVKVLPFHLAEQDPGMIKRFYREAQIAAQVRSPHLVNVLDVNEESGLFFLVMEFVAGATAGHLVKSSVEKIQTGLTELDVLDIAIGASEGLHAAHAQGIVHRDLKPENIMVPYKSRREKTYDLKNSKLMDLGLARSEESNQQSLTGVQAAMGTPGYMAPEQALDAKTADKRSDVFGMGATIYALLTGHAPFRGEAVMKVLMATMHEPHEPVIKSRPEVSSVLSEIVDKCLDKKQDSRYADAQQLLRALRNCRKLLTKGEVDEYSEGDGKDMAALSSSRGAPGTLTGVAARSSSSDATLIGPPPTLPGMSGAAATAKPQSKSMLMVVAGVGALLLAVGAFFVLKGKNTPIAENPPGKIDGPGKSSEPGPAKPPARTLTPEEMKSKRKAFASYSGLLKDALESSDLESAELYLGNLKDVAAVMPAGDDVHKQLADFQTSYANVGKEKEFQNKIKEIDLAFARSEYAKAMKIVVEEAKPVTKQGEELLAAKQKQIQARQTYNKLVKDAEAAPADKVQLALDNVKKARTVMPDTPEEKARLDKLEARLQDQDKYNSQMAIVKKFEGEKQYQQAYDSALVAEKLIADPVDAKDAIKRLIPRLDQAARDAAAKQAKLDFDTSYSLAQKELAAGNFDEAERQASMALSKSTEPKDNTDATNLKTLVQTKRKAFQDSRDQQKVAGLLKEGVEIFAKSGDADGARLKIEEAKQTDANNAALLAFEKTLGDFVKFEDAAKKALKEKRIGDADAAIKQALALAPNSASSKKISDDVLKIKNAELAAKQDEAKKRQSLSDAVKEGDDLLAQSKFADAVKAFEKGKPFAQALSEADADSLAKKIDQAKTSEAKRLAAIENDIRNSFSKKLAEAETAGAGGKFDDAIRLASEAKTLIKDNPAFNKDYDKMIERERAFAAAKSAKAENDYVATARKTVAGKFAQADLTGALAEVETARKTYPQREEWVQIAECAGALKEISPTASALPAQYTDFETKLKGRPSGELAKLGALRDTLTLAVKDALAKLSAPDFTDTRGLSASLRQSQARLRELGDLVQKLEKQARQRDDKIPDPDNGSGRRTSTPEPKKKSGGGSVGEGNVDD